MNEYTIDDAIADLLIEWQSKQWKLSAEENDEYQQELLQLYIAKKEMGLSAIPEDDAIPSESHTEGQNHAEWGVVEGIKEYMKDKVVKRDGQTW